MLAVGLAEGWLTAAEPYFPGVASCTTSDRAGFPHKVHRRGPGAPRTFFRGATDTLAKRGACCSAYLPSSVGGASGVRSLTAADDLSPPE